MLIQSFFFADKAGVSKYHTEVEDGNSTCAIRGYGFDVVQGSKQFIQITSNLAAPSLPIWEQFRLW
jgi:hypothetical protein